MEDSSRQLVWGPELIRESQLEPKSHLRETATEASERTLLPRKEESEGS